MEHEQPKLVIGMVGLPARGKTYLSKKLCQYLNWIRVPTRDYNIGQYRREQCGSAVIKPDFFDPHNQENVKKRQ